MKSAKSHKSASRRQPAQEPLKVADNYSAEKHLRKFCTVTSHELGNVLGAIVGELDYGITQLLPETQRQAMQIALSAAERAQTLARNLRYFAVHTRLDIHTIDLSQLVLDTLELMEKDLERHNVNLAVYVDASTFITADGGAIQQVLSNLLSNAAYAMPHGGKLTLTLRQLPRSIELAVTDTGIGIPAEVVDRVFEPYFFSDGRSYSESLGLGLAVSKALVEAHGGEISVDSREGEGTTFAINLPFDPNLPKPQAFAEKRRFRRVNVTFPVEVRFEGDPQPLTTELITLSVGGAFILIPEQLPKPAANRLLRLKLFYYQNEIIEVPKARIAAVCRVGSQSGMGVEFLEVSAKAKKILAALVKSHAS